MGFTVNNILILYCATISRPLFSWDSVVNSDAVALSPSISSLRATGTYVYNTIRGTNRSTNTVKQIIHLHVPYSVSVCNKRYVNSFIAVRVLFWFIVSFLQLKQKPLNCLFDPWVWFCHHLFPAPEDAAVRGAWFVDTPDTPTSGPSESGKRTLFPWEWA